ncbi:hypothetical protein DFJ73DRAFT_848396 [Zopfochytrium polystomum]|nr:hypothetical protein DFJ73DRAFT_848396 [Zopfochytrium polystomum]
MPVCLSVCLQPCPIRPPLQDCAHTGPPSLRPFPSSHKQLQFDSSSSSSSSVRCPRPPARMASAYSSSRSTTSSASYHSYPAPPASTVSSSSSFGPSPSLASTSMATTPSSHSQLSQLHGPLSTTPATSSSSASSASAAPAQPAPARGVTLGDLSVDLLVPSPSKKFTNPSGLVVIRTQDTGFAATLRITSHTRIPHQYISIAQINVHLFVGKGPLPEKSSIMQAGKTEFDPEGNAAAGQVHKNPVYHSSVAVCGPGNPLDIPPGTKDIPVVVPCEVSVPPTITDATVSDTRKDVTYVLYLVLRQVDSSPIILRKDITLRRGAPWVDPRKTLLEGPMVNDMVQYQLFVPEVIHIGDPTASVTIILDAAPDLSLKSIQCTWVEVYHYEEKEGKTKIREHVLSKVLRMSDSMPNVLSAPATNEIVHKFEAPSRDAAPDCDHRAVVPTVHPMLKAFGGSAKVSHEVRIKVEYKPSRSVSVLIDGIMARVPFSCVTHGGSGIVRTAKKKKDNRASMMSSASSVFSFSDRRSMALSDAMYGGAASHYEGSVIGRVNSIRSNASSIGTVPGSSIVDTRAPPVPVTPSERTLERLRSPKSPKQKDSNLYSDSNLFKTPPSNLEFLPMYQSSSSSSSTSTSDFDSEASSSVPAPVIPNLFRTDTVTENIEPPPPFSDFSMRLETVTSPPPPPPPLDLFPQADTRRGTQITEIPPPPLPTSFLQPMIIPIRVNSQRPSSEVFASSAAPSVATMRQVEAPSMSSARQSEPNQGSSRPKSMPAPVAPPRKTTAFIDVKSFVASKSLEPPMSAPVIATTSNPTSPSLLPSSMPPPPLPFLPTIATSGPSQPSSSSATRSLNAPPLPPPRTSSARPIPLQPSTTPASQPPMPPSLPSHSLDPSASSATSIPTPTPQFTPPATPRLASHPEHLTYETMGSAEARTSQQPVSKPKPPPRRTEAPQPQVQQHQSYDPPPVEFAQVTPVSHLTGLQKSAVTDYRPQHADEITVGIGDLLYVQSAWSDGFAHGVNLTTRQFGIFPQTCLFGIPSRRLTSYSPDPDNSRNASTSPERSPTLTTSSTKSSYLPRRATTKDGVPLPLPRLNSWRPPGVEEDDEDETSSAGSGHTGKKPGPMVSANAQTFQWQSDVNRLASVSKMLQHRHLVVHPYVAREADELSASVGDLVFFGDVNDDGWAWGVNETKKIKGYFPAVILGPEFGGPPPASLAGQAATPFQHQGL